MSNFEKEQKESLSRLDEAVAELVKQASILQADANLSDVQSASSSRDNLELGTAAIFNSEEFEAAGAAAAEAERAKLAERASDMKHDMAALQASLLATEVAAKAAETAKEVAAVAAKAFKRYRAQTLAGYLILVFGLILLLNNIGHVQTNTQAHTNSVFMQACEGVNKNVASRRTQDTILAGVIAHSKFPNSVVASQQLLAHLPKPLNCGPVK